jgi:hypothetical protein
MATMTLLHHIHLADHMEVHHAENHRRRHRPTAGLGIHPGSQVSGLARPLEPRREPQRDTQQAAGTQVVQRRDNLLVSLDGAAAGWASRLLVGVTWRVRAAVGMNRQALAARHDVDDVVDAEAGSRRKGFTYLQAVQKPGGVNCM